MVKRYCDVCSGECTTTHTEEILLVRVNGKPVRLDTKFPKGDICYWCRVAALEELVAAKKRIPKEILR